MTAEQDKAPDTRERLSGPALIADTVKRLPNGPGVYRMLDAAGEVLYVGKARDLKKRVANYAKGIGHTNRIARMIAETAEMVIVTTRSETEALLLEANLIKRMRPRYNVSYRDDKSFPHILLRTDHAFPQVLKHRGAKSQKGHYFGPFASAYSVSRTLNTLQRAFLLRSCSDSVFEGRTRPCLLFQIKRCSAPCVGRIDEAGYAALVGDAEKFLRGDSDPIREHLLAEMNAASQALDFEKAAAYRDRIRAIARIEANQAVNPETFDEADVFAIHLEAGRSCVQVFFFRAGQNWGNRAYFPTHDKGAEAPEILESLIAQFYDDKTPPKQIIVSEKLENADLLAEALSVKAERKVDVLTPQRGEKRAIVDQALLNAKEELGRRLAENQAQGKLLAGVAELFGLENAPNRIEVYDNSHISGTNAVGGMIVAGPDGFVKKAYRKFNMKGKEIAPGDDYAMLREMLTRRFARLLKEEAGDDPDAAASEPAEWPDLVLIDGGPGQLKIAQDVLAELNITDVPLVAIAKGPERDAGREHFHVPGKAPFRLELKDPVLYYLQRLRDEAHRFAIGSHRQKRAKAIGVNPLDEIPGIGAARKRALLHHFGSARAVASASEGDIAAVSGVSAAIAKRIYDFFHPAG